MPRYAGLLPPGLAALLLAGCGYVGEPLPPSLKIPAGITDLSAFERGNHLLIAFNIPPLTTDGVPLRRLVDVDLRIANQGEALEMGRRVETGAAQPGPVHVEIAVDNLAGRDVVVAVRTAGRKNRYSAWSNLVRLRIIPPLPAPAGLRAEAVAQGVRLGWKPDPGARGYRIYRRAPNEAEPTEIGRSEQAEYIDSAARYGLPYQYMVQAVVKAGDAEAESVRSATVSITPVDTFPPAVPAGLAAVAGIANVQLSWTPDADADLKGYWVYRAAAGQPFQRLGELLPTPAYTDRAVESGKRYQYAVSAVDQSGNESARSAPVEAAAQ